MYSEGETGISEDYLQQVIESIEEPIVVLGGWAVRFLVNEGYRGLTGRGYLGSRDIDIGFSMKEQILDRTSFAKAYDVLIHDLGFRPLSFRLFKEMHAETGEALDEETARNLPPHQVTHMYVDMIVDRIPEDFREHFGFTPIDEPLLSHVFLSRKKRIEIERFGRAVWIPTADVLLAMKVRSCPGRDRTHKKVKDVCDIAVISMFGLLSRDEGWSSGLISKENIEGFRKVVKREDLSTASEILGIARETMEGSMSGLGLL
ncbi:MAG: hypothetical protein ACE5IO_06220 [Thermoplasmata archaeon]